MIEDGKERDSLYWAKWQEENKKRAFWYELHHIFHTLWREKAFFVVVVLLFFGLLGILKSMGTLGLD